MLLLILTGGFPFILEKVEGRGEKRTRETDRESTP